MSKLQREQMLDRKIKAYQDVFNGSQEGQLVLFDLIEQCQVFTVNTRDPHASAILEGRRLIGVYLMQMVGLAPLHGKPFEPLHMKKMIDTAESADRLHKIHLHETQPNPNNMKDGEINNDR